MAQKVFNQWAPVAKALNEQGQEVYLPFAGIHAQTRDGEDEIIVGAGNMVWTGSMWVPVSTQNRLPVDAAVSGTVDVSDRADRQLGKVALSGQTVQIGGVTFEFDPPRTIYGLAASRPTASAVHAVVPFAVYVSVDTKVIEQTDGSSWRRWGVA